MDSLTTAYLVCMLIGSGCAIGGAVAGNRVFPIESSAITSAPVISPPQNTAQTQPAISSEAQ